MRSHITMMTTPTARKLGAPIFCKKLEKCSIVSIPAFIKVALHQMLSCCQFKLFLCQWKYYNLCCKKQFVLYLVILRQARKYLCNSFDVNNLDKLLTIFVKKLLKTWLKGFQGWLIFTVRSKMPNI